MMPKKIETALNNQIKMEAQASFLYLSMSSWCDRHGLQGCTEFLRRQADEEMAHMLKLFDYIAEVDGMAKAPGIEQPSTEFSSIQDLFSSVYEHEKRVTTSINKILDLCYKEEDYSTLNFLQWYVDEQREEEALMRTILDRIKLIGQGPSSLYYIDKELDAINNNVNNTGEVK